MSKTDRLGPVLESQLLNGKVLLEDLGGAVEGHLDVGEDGEALPAQQRGHLIDYIR